MSVHKHVLRSVMGILSATLILAGMAASPAIAQEKAKASKAERGQATHKILAENDKVRVTEVYYKPGDVLASPPSSSTRVLRAIKGGTLLWTYADGKAEKVVLKTGDVKLVEPGPQFTVKNIGKSEVVLYSVIVK